VTGFQAGADVDRAHERTHWQVVMLPDVVDCVIGADTHRDKNQVGIAYPSGAVIAAGSSATTAPVRTGPLTWVFEHAPGARLVISIEGTQLRRRAGPRGRFRGDPGD
jgi:hypothetical protein